MITAATDLLVATASHGAACLAFAAFAAVLWLSGNRQGPALYLIIACATTALWSGTVAGIALEDEARTLPDLVLETLRSVSWIAFLYRMLLESARQHGASIPRLIVVPVLLFFASLVAADVALINGGGPLIASYTIIGRLITSIIALTLIENLARNDWPRAQWWARFLFVGLGGIFAYDLFFYSEALLFHRVNLDLYAVRGAVDMIAVPLMAVSFARNPTFAVKIHVSRQFVFHSMTLAGTGVYLLLMAIAGYYLKNFGGTWGTLIQVIFFSAALVIVFLTLSSGTFRSAVRNFVSTHFFSYKYDYRHEWLQFIKLISAQESLLPLHDRVIQAIANIVDSPSGTLWVLRDEVYVNTAVWNAPLGRDARLTDGRLTEWFEATGRIVDLRSTMPAETPAGIALPEFLTQFPRAWIAMPLVHRHRLLGFLVLAIPRAPRRLDDEDYRLLTTAGNQAASYIAEEETSRALLDAQQLEMFNKRFAFVIHDIKNIVSQLSLVLSNVERHGDNPEFQRDVISTVRHSVGRMKGLLEQISQAKRASSESAPFDLAPFDLAGLVRRDWGGKEALYPRLRLALPEDVCTIRGEAETVSQVLRHVVQNALEAISEDGQVELRLERDGIFALLMIADDGPGMTPEFIRDTLFRPFGTTKKSGYGIGAYQARELIRQMGGRLEVTSATGEGTQVRIYLPLVAGIAATPRQVQEA
ncbi:MAG: PEP-CTERM system histidine kinase PrsK [Alphaproteobacteria bacterium]|nr:PEP-CTERM system histidine kinase PrsK [Alphaproteobacteria bacterium]